MSCYVDTPLEAAEAFIERAILAATFQIDCKERNSRHEAEEEAITSMLALLMKILPGEQTYAVLSVIRHVARRATLDLVASMPRGK